MNIPKEVYKMLLKHCGDEKNIKGTTTTSLRMMKQGKLEGMTTTTIKNLCRENGVEAKIEFTHIYKGDPVSTTIKIFD